MDSQVFRTGHWVIDLSDQDAQEHLRTVGFTGDTTLIMKYFMFFLLEDTSRMGANEFSERHDEITGALADVLTGRLSPAARQLCPVIEGIVNDSLVNDGCITSAKPYPRWTGTLHEHEEPRNFYQLLEGALRDPRSRIGRVIDYPPSEEISHVSEMIRNPSSHGSMSAGTLEDYTVLFFLLVLLYHDVVNPHRYIDNHKYRKWVHRMRVDSRLGGVAPTNEGLEKLAVDAGLDIEELRKSLGPGV